MVVMIVGVAVVGGDVDDRIAQLDRVIVGGGCRRLKLSVTPAALVAVGAEMVDDLALPL